METTDGRRPPHRGVAARGRARRYGQDPPDTGELNRRLAQRHSSATLWAMTEAPAPAEAPNAVAQQPAYGMVLVIAGLLGVLVVLGQTPALGGRGVLLAVGALVSHIVIGVVLRKHAVLALGLSHVIVLALCVSERNAFLTQVPTYMPLAFNVGRRTSGRQSALVVIAALVTLLPAYVLFPSDFRSETRDWGSLVLTAMAANLLFIVLPVVVGQWMRWHNERLGLAVRILEAERGEARETLARALGEERARMARELHDIAAHHMTAVLINAKVARKKVEEDSPDVKRYIEEIAHEASTAHRSLGEVVALLNNGDALQADSQLRPSVGDIPGLVAQARRLNPRITLELDETADESRAAGLAVYRIVQESLTNAHRYAPCAPIAISVHRDDYGTHVRVANELSSQPQDVAGGNGAGLIGMHARAVALGGELTAGPVDSGWVVEARIPSCGRTTSSVSGGPR